MNQAQEIQQVAQEILINLADIHPEISACGMDGVSEKLTIARNLAKELAKGAGINQEQIVAGYKTAAQDNLLGLIESVMNLEPMQPVTDGELHMSYLAAQSFVRRYTEYHIKKQQLEEQ